MATVKLQKPAVGTSLFGKKEASKVGEAAAAASKGSKSATKKAAASKPQEPKKKVCFSDINSISDVIRLIN